MTALAGRPVTTARVLRIAVPVVLANATVPLQGAVDTAIIGNLGEARFLAAVTLGATAVTLLLASFNFLQMGVSGLAAQAIGAGAPRRAIDTLARALLIAGAIAAVLVVLRRPVAELALGLFEGSEEAEALAARYIDIRLWGAPAELGIYALIGWFAGQELTRRLLELQLLVSGGNIGFNLLFAVGFGWGVEGVALGTACAAWIAVGFGLLRVRARIRAIAPEGWRPEAARLLEPAELARVVALNRDIFIRTVCLTASLAWMARLGSIQGDVILAANGVLMQFVHLASHALDGFAMAAETLVGQALGARDRAGLRRAVATSGLAAVALAAGFSVVASLGADAAIGLFTNVPEVRAAATAFAFWATCLPLVSVLAYHLDGVFIGAADGASMRNAMLVSAALFVAASWLLTGAWGNHGLWLALWLYMLTRAATLAIHYPALEARAAG